MWFKNWVDGHALTQTVNIGQNTGMELGVGNRNSEFYADQVRFEIGYRNEGAKWAFLGRSPI